MATTRFNLNTILKYVPPSDGLIMIATICRRIKRTQMLLWHIRFAYREFQIKQAYADAIDAVVDEYIRTNMLDPAPFLMSLKFDKERPYFSKQKLPT